MPRLIVDIDRTLTDIPAWLAGETKFGRVLWNISEKTGIANYLARYSPVRQNAKAMLVEAHHAGVENWIVSGRGISIERATRDWFHHNQIPYDTMRLCRPGWDIIQHKLTIISINPHNCIIFEDQQDIVDAIENHFGANAPLCYWPGRIEGVPMLCQNALCPLNMIRIPTKKVHLYLTSCPFCRHELIIAPVHRWAELDDKIFNFKHLHGGRI